MSRVPTRTRCASEPRTASPGTRWVGYTHALRDLTIVVRALTPDGRPAEIECRFASPLEDDSRGFAIWTRDGYRRFELPAIGGAVVSDDVSLRDARQYQYR